MKNMLKLGLSLAVYASVACVSLAFVNNFTSSVIAETKEKERQAALFVVFPEATSFEPAPGFTPDTSTAVKVTGLDLAKNGDEVVGAVVLTNGPTYDKAELLIGITLNRTITGLQFLSLSDTPGIGQRATEPTFTNQFLGKSIDDPFEAGQDMEGVSGASITTRGVSQIIKYATYVASEYLATNYGGTAGTGAAPVIAKEATPFTYEDACTSLFPSEEYPMLAFVEVTEGVGDNVRTMKVERKVLVTSDNTVIAAMVAVRGKTFRHGGVVMTAVAPNGNIIGSRILELNDTKNRGQLTLQESFYNQFSGLSASETILRSDEKYDVIAGASITSDSVADMVKVGAVEAVNLLAQQELGITALDQNNYQLNENLKE